MEFGIYTFGDLAPDERSPAHASRRLAEIIDAARLADDAGLDVFGVGEHHRGDFAVSSPATVLAAIAAVTRRIRLTSAVSILSSDDPVRLYQQFSTVDLISNGRAELLVGRGAYVESFPLFGYRLDDYDALFDEKLDLLIALDAAPHVTWQGRHRAPLRDAQIVPRPLANTLPLWIAAGGTPASARRAGTLGLPLNLANISGRPEQFKPFIELYRETGRAARHADSNLAIAISGHFHVQRDGTRARDTFFPYYRDYFRFNLPHVYRNRSLTRDEYDTLTGPHGALFVGSVQEIVDKILYEHELFGHQRYMAQLDIGGLPRDVVRNTIELFASDVAPAVRRVLKDG
ncbi:LLM class flavin-dependent oxidoreductase [Burkholderia lata]|uniref:LLM class flavin-dependent oxidoreductase n=1 Tax=Burkholderia lata (strain ATCC 17760 / DSM 23089 / LMG 22485 / NCIMB 9086 / R18194 / 383) TaxID=482957 RepID=UPI0014533D29|nr:LLM class flavin-dependent oxidoreductase [Burkholderia lata]VWB44258.1 oxidoreductase [Burkholderia lata]